MCLNIILFPRSLAPVIIAYILCSFAFTHASDCLGIYPSINYNAASLDSFISNHRESPYMRVDTLCTTDEGRIVPFLYMGKLDGEPLHRYLITARHHANEMKQSWSLEGFMKTILSGHGGGAWLRENVEFFVVPIVDLDGVEKGEEGKGRKPHDHNRDYIAPEYPRNSYEHPVHEEVKAIMEKVPQWSNGKWRMGVDMHCNGHGGKRGMPFFYFPMEKAEIEKPLRDSIIKEIEAVGYPCGGNKGGYTPHSNTAWCERFEGVGGLTMEMGQCEWSRDSAELIGLALSNALESYSRYLSATSTMGTEQGTGMHIPISAKKAGRASIVYDLRGRWMNIDGNGFVIGPAIHYNNNRCLLKILHTRE